MAMQSSKHTRACCVGLDVPYLDFGVIAARAQPTIFQLHHTSDDDSMQWYGRTKEGKKEGGLGY